MRFFSDLWPLNAPTSAKSGLYKMLADLYDSKQRYTCFRLLLFSDINISQGGVLTCSAVDVHFLSNILPSLSVKEF